MIYLKDRATMQTRKMVQEISFDLTVESYADDGGTVIVPVGAVGPEDQERWLIHDARVYLVTTVLPSTDRTTIRVGPPHKAFDREVPYPGPAATTAAFLAGVMAGFANEPDPLYRLGGLQVLPMADREMIKPDEVIDAEEGLAEGEELGLVLFNVADYIKKLRTYGIFVTFWVLGDTLQAEIRQRTLEIRQVIFGDGRSILDRRSYGAADTVAKVTIREGETATIYYLAEDGTIQTTPPSPRVPGRWLTKVITVGEDEDRDAAIQDAARAAFGTASGAHKVEFWSTMGFRLGDVAVMRLDGQRVAGTISKVEETSANIRRRYATGDLVTTQTGRTKGGSK